MKTSSSTSAEAQRATVSTPLGYVLVPIEATNEMIAAYLQANDAYWRAVDSSMPRPLTKWRNGTPSEATAESYRAMIGAAAPAPLLQAPQIQQPNTFHLPLSDGSHGLVQATPSSHWKQEGDPDPHGKTYDCERAGLTLGYLTDDELANGAFMNYDRRLSVEDMMNPKPGQHMPIVWMTAAKERIRWLSRSLDAALGNSSPARQEARQDEKDSVSESAAPLLPVPAHRDVLAERQRQIKDEGWTPEHDSDHDPGDLAAAAACYATGVPDAHTLQYSNGNEVWPWAPEEFRPGRAVDRSADGLGPVSRIPDFRRDLVRAGALILAEIERLDRAALRASSAPTTTQPTTKE